MSCRSGIAIVLLSCFSLTACYAQPGGTYGYNAYRPYPAPAMAPPPLPPSYQPPSYQPPPPLQSPPASATAEVTPPQAAEIRPASPATIFAGAAAPEAPPATADISGPPSALPPLILPVHEDWAPAKCSGLAVTFTGHPQTVATLPGDTVSFQETRQVQEDGYAEGAECFCAKGANLTDMTESAAKVVMTRTGRQISDQLHMQVHAITYVEASPLGTYSELEASADEPKAKAILRIFWRGQCSVRIMSVSDPSSEARAVEFLSSLRNSGGEAKAASSEPVPAVPVAAVYKAPLPTNEIATARMLPGTVKSNAGQPADRETKAKPVETAEASDVAESASTADAVTRLRQLQELKRDGLITKAEYDAKRLAILKGL